MGNLLANRRTHLQSRTQVHSFRFALIYLRPCLTLHPPTVNRQFRAQLFQAGKSDKITFSKIKSFTLKNRGNTCFLINYGISVKKTPLSHKKTTDGGALPGIFRMLHDSATTCAITNCTPHVAQQRNDMRKSQRAQFRSDIAPLFAGFAEEPRQAFMYATGAATTARPARASEIAPCNQKLWDTRPSRNLGSNQVDLGGMISPASAIAIS